MDKIDILWAREQTKETKARYSRYTDLRMTEDFLGVFTEDLVWTWLPLQLAAVFGDYLESLKKKRLYGFSVHHGRTVEIDVVDEDNATTIWSM
ncbi:nuclear transport factor 2 family protein [Streptomyces sp. NPDC046900]|uniref:nuclear transport factor 2 family protein n=1 Tax=Streptomyces sp. NPDC046900 TaxID=3155473 RepID=UPI0033DF210B